MVADMAAAGWEKMVQKPSLDLFNSKKLKKLKKEELHHYLLRQRGEGFKCS